jgi:hypothetical protein
MLLIPFRWRIRIVPADADAASAASHQSLDKKPAANADYSRQILPSTIESETERHTLLTRRQKANRITLKRLQWLAARLPVSRRRRSEATASLVDSGLLRGFTSSIGSSDSSGGRSNAATISGPTIGNMNTFFPARLDPLHRGRRPVVFELFK